jgi:Replication-relaxation
MSRVQLQERDLDMLTSIGQTRMLTAGYLEWLHFPQWRGHYRRYLERAERDPLARYKIRPHLYERLADLRASLLIAMLDRARPCHPESIPAACSLTRRGAALLSAEREVDRSALWVLPSRSNPPQQTEHMLLIGRCYAALHAEAAYRGQALDGWRGDHLLRASAPGDGPGYDRIRLPDLREPVSLIPDATCVLNGQRLFFEIDRGTQMLRQWATKLRAYDAYQGSRLLRERYQTDQFQVLIVAPDQRRLERIAAEIARVSREHRDRYRLIEERLLHPTTIRRGWRTVTHAVFTPRMIGGRLVETVEQVALEQAPLWSAE